MSTAIDPGAVKLAVLALLAASVGFAASVIALGHQMAG